MAGPKIKGNQRLISHDHKAGYFWPGYVSGAGLVDRPIFLEITGGIELVKVLSVGKKEYSRYQLLLHLPPKTNMTIGKTTMHED